MAITTDHLVGAAVGIGVAAVGFYLYKKNQDSIDDFLRGHGLNIPVRENKPLATLFFGGRFNSLNPDDLEISNKVRAYFLENPAAAL